MKLINIFIAIVLTTLIITNASAQNKKESKKGDRDEITVQVDGLGCPFCAYGLEKKMKELKGVKKFKIAMESGLTSFTFPSSEKISIEEIRYQVTKAGYTPMSMTITRADGTVEESIYEEQKIDYTANQTIEFNVAGNCNMCKSRIERVTMGLYGVAEAKWNKKKKFIKVEYLDSEVNEQQIHEAISGAGYDTERMTADDSMYDALPGCCQYKRMDKDLITPFEKNEGTDNVE